MLISESNNTREKADEDIKVFQKMPMHLRAQMTEDIILTMIDSGAELKNLPVKWKRSRKNT